MFSKFQVRYGHKWTSSLPTDELTRLAVTEWAGVLAGVEGGQVKRGLSEWREDWPPSACEFRKACIGNDGKLHQSAAYREFRALLKPPRDKAIGLSALAGMRKGLG